MAGGGSPLSRQWESGSYSDMAEAGRRQEEEESGLLDVSSPRFDPYLALYSRCQPPLPFPNVRTFNNMAEYQSFLQRGFRERPTRTTATPGRQKSRGRRGARPPPDPDRIERLKKLMVAEPSSDERPRPRRRERAPKNVLTRMARAARLLQPGARYVVGHGYLHDCRQGCFVIGQQEALVDVDETFRKPILGKAFYNEPALTVSRLFDRLKLQEGSVGEETGAMTMEQTSCLSKRFEDGRAELDDSKSLSCVVETEPVQVTPDTFNFSAQSEAVDLDRSKRNSEQTNLELRTPTGEKKKRKMKAQPRVDYQQVSQRHVKQLFIRGENILLISLMQ